MAPVVLGVIESDGDAPLPMLFRFPCDGVSTFKGGVRLSEGLDVSLLRLDGDLYGFSPWVSLSIVSACHARFQGLLLSMQVSSKKIRSVECSLAVSEVARICWLLVT
jgi:hypothetical protein